MIDLLHFHVLKWTGQGIDNPSNFWARDLAHDAILEVASMVTHRDLGNHYLSISQQYQR